MLAPNLLLVDDDPLALSLVAGILTSSLPDAHLRTCDNADKAREICATEAIDCLLVDYDMPDTNGLVLAQFLRERQPYLPIILCTGAGDERLAVEALKSGLTDYIPKTLMSPQSLRRAIDNAIELTARARTIDEQRADLEAFAFALAHDFKQPIRQIITFSELVGREIGDTGTERQGMLLKFMTDAATRLDRLVEAVAQYALLRETPEVEAVRISEAVRDVIESIQVHILERNGAVRVERDAVVYANRTLLGQVLQNLIVNGLKFNESPRPTITIAAEPDGVDVSIRVHDNGIGIEGDYLNLIFEPLARLHTRHEYDGSGLGLTLVRKAVRAQGGAIACQSEPGTGSTFIVRLPAGEQADAGASGAREPAAAAH